MKDFLAILPIDGGAISGGSGVPTGGATKLFEIISLGLTLLIIGGILLCLFYFIWGGIDWLMSEGEKEKIKLGRDKIAYSIVGLVIIFLSFLLIRTFIGLFLPDGGYLPCLPGRPC